MGGACLDLAFSRSPLVVLLLEFLYISSFFAGGEGHILVANEKFSYLFWPTLMDPVWGMGFGWGLLSYCSLYRLPSEWGVVCRRNTNLYLCPRSMSTCYCAAHLKYNTPTRFLSLGELRLICPLTRTHCERPLEFFGGRDGRRSLCNPDSTSAQLDEFLARAGHFAPWGESGTVPLAECPT